MRIFAAIELEPAIRGALAEAAQTLRDALPGVRWTRPENLHLTLRFLGEVAVEGTGPVGEALLGAAETTDSFALRCAGPAVFPSARRPSVLVVELTGETAALEALGGLVRRFERSLRTLGFAAERRAFQPHVSIGRVRRPPRGGRSRDRTAPVPSGQALERILARARWPREPVAVDHVVLFESNLTPGGPLYTPLVTARLRG